MKPVYVVERIKKGKYSNFISREATEIEKIAYYSYFINDIETLKIKENDSRELHVYKDNAHNFLEKRLIGMEESGKKFLKLKKKDDLGVINLDRYRTKGKGKGFLIKLIATMDPGRAKYYAWQMDKWST